MRMRVTLEFADAGTKSGSHRVLIIGRGAEDRTGVFFWLMSRSLVQRRIYATAR
jgi:hypothetical protein